MGRKRKPDRLDREAKAASDAGLSYGKWKALQPPDKPAPPPKPKNKVERTCVRCGKTFYRSNKLCVKYCSPECQHEAKTEREKLYRQQNHEEYREYQRLYKTGFRKKEAKNAVSQL